MGRVVALGAFERRGSAPACRELRIDAEDYFDDLTAGASVAVNGVCLTLRPGPFRRGGPGVFDVVHETLRCTNLGAFRPGDAVNLERSLRVGDRIDGHFVQGHVDARGRVARIENRSEEWKMWIDVAETASRAIIAKGSVAIDGVSLTVVDVHPGAFSVALIPTTLSRTTLGRSRPGDSLNIETDVLARAILSRLESLGIAAGTAGVPRDDSDRRAAGEGRP